MELPAAKPSKLSMSVGLLNPPVFLPTPDEGVCLDTGALMACSNGFADPGDGAGRLRIYQGAVDRVRDPFYLDRVLRFQVDRLREPLIVVVNQFVFGRHAPDRRRFD